MFDARLSVPPQMTRAVAFAGMTYSDFTIESIQSQLGLAIKQDLLFAQVEPTPAPQWLQEALSRALPLGLTSEKARSEFIVAPILLAGREVTGNRFYIYSGQRLDADATLGLTGECDFLLTRAEPSLVLKAPIMTIVEAKRNDIEVGLGQCIAQMLGARLFNEAKGSRTETVFGCVTTGEAWQFLKLEGRTVVIDAARYYVDNVEKILGALQAVVNYFEAPASAEGRC
jgi:hypothetical protein